MHPVSSTDRYSFNHEYGFGVVNAEGAVDLAKRWTNLPASQRTTVESDILGVTIPDASVDGDPSTFTHTLTVDSGIGFTEFVEVTVSFEHESFRDLEILLESPLPGPFQELSLRSTPMTLSAPSLEPPLSRCMDPSSLGRPSTWEKTPTLSGSFM